MGEPKQHRRNRQRRSPSHPPFQQVLHPRAKVKFLRNSNKNEDIDPRRNHREPRRVAMKMEKAQRQPQPQDQWRKESQFAQPSFPVAPAEVKVKAGSAEPPDRDESIQRSIDEEQFPQARE